MRYVFVDTETGGLDPKVHGITEIGAVAFDVNMDSPLTEIEPPGSRFQIMIQPNATLAYTPYALRLQDRTLETLSRGVRELGAWRDFKAFLDTHLGHYHDWRGRIVAHCAEFDHGFLAALADRCDDPEVIPASERCEWVCTKNLFRFMHGIGVVPHPECGQNDIMDRYKITYEGRQHTALADALAGIRMFRHMLDELKQYYEPRRIP